eukprot:TRINITY_DN10342_c0_g2_i1.p1 TRINITY_DN10342_c0_g2~~TRINITY_DN10342_c0_g2_i1.p1  ORF type:complete len:487 (+),score=119.14 TRINITY_DN10342_c0_g2_i1:81-1463(+)
MLLWSLAALATGCLDPRTFGAVPGTHAPYDLFWANNTAAVQAAIDAATAGAGGGCVSLSGGDFVTADISLRSNTVFRIESDARLVAAANHTKAALLGAKNVSNLTLAGGGVVYGNAERYISYYAPDPDDRFQPSSPDGHRPRLVMLDRSTDIVVNGLRIHNASDWNLHIRGCARVLVDGVDIRGSWQFPNNDGIDPDSSVDVTIINSNIDVADDGICPKASAGYGPLRNLLVRNCTVRSKSHALKFGSNTDTEMSGILFDGVRIWDSNGGIAIQQRSAGDIHNVTWRNIEVETRYVAPRWWGNGEWLWITSQPRNKGDAIGRLYDLHFANISARTENGGYIGGLANGVQNVTFDNVSVTVTAWTNYSADGVRLCLADEIIPFPCRGTVDHRPAPEACSECRQRAAANGILFESVDGVALNEVSVAFEQQGAERPQWYGKCVATHNSVNISGADRVTCRNG